MSFRRYEIILPTRYNDGGAVEPEKFLLTNRELSVQFGAVKSHLRSIFNRLNVLSRTEAVTAASRRGLVQL